MGGIEENALLRLRFRDGVFGNVRISREFDLANRCTMEFEKGSVVWRPNKPESLQICRSEEIFALKGVLRAKRPMSFPHAVAGRQFEVKDAFVLQLGNVIETLRGRERLIVPAEQAMHCVRLVEECYSQRRLMRLPWFTDAEYRSALASTRTSK